MEILAKIFTLVVFSKIKAVDCEVQMEKGSSKLRCSYRSPVCRPFCKIANNLCDMKLVFSELIFIAVDIYKIVRYETIN